MCTLDIKSLYTRVPYKEGTEAVLEKLKEDPGLTNQKISFIKNDFKFGPTHYLQTQGTSMGSPVALSVAKIFMASFEQKFVQNSPYMGDIVTWFRYVDNVFMLWRGNQEKWTDLVLYLNARHELIEFTINQNSTTIQYLDVEVYTEEDQLHTKLYTKPSDRNNMLQRESYHAPKVFGGIPKGKFTRA